MKREEGKGAGRHAPFSLISFTLTYWSYLSFGGGGVETELLPLHDGPSNFRRLRPGLSLSLPLQANIFSCLSHSHWKTTDPLLSSIPFFRLVIFMFLNITSHSCSFQSSRLPLILQMWTYLKCVNYVSLFVPQLIWTTPVSQVCG